MSIKFVAVMAMIAAKEMEVMGEATETTEGSEPVNRKKNRSRKDRAEASKLKGGDWHVTTKKTDLDISRERIADEINVTLVGTGVSVSSGGRKGPYTLVVERLSRRELDRLISVVLGATGRSKKGGTR